ncbi:hypothetical protein JG687_00015880 [Phytophthora cactorum]|uniref:START-like domain n=1 Tax=Phytophthora cactorum TaxID=29920 RepID=A0A8T1TV42_9STRA|nr:hypothetical protein JG687_00015880 [Phytophthora cactorum]
MTRRTSDADFSPTTWTTNALPPVELSTDQREKYRQLATQLLSNTLRDYDIYSADSRQRRMSRRRWKPVKTRDHITVYKERYPTPSSLASTNHQTGVPSRTSRASIADRVSMAFRGGNEWTEPKLLVATGWIEGALDDVMYGVSSPDAQSMLMKATVVKNTLVNGAVLACIDAPCDADPFRFLGIKWFVKGPPTGLQGIVRPRDLVFIEATGVTTRPNGERIGYQLLHSVDLPQYRDLTPQSRMEVTRGRISSCSIFREIPAGLGSRHSKVDVYVKGYVEAHGKLLDSVALTAASTGLMSSWNSVECANLKKLMWCFRQQPDWGLSRTLKEVNKELWLRQEDVLICKRCVLRVDNVAAVDVARAEVAAGWFSVESVPTSSYGCSKSFASTGVTTDTDLPIDSFRGVEPAKEPYPDIPEPSEELQVEKKKKEKVMLSDRERREQIWSQMVELRMLAESIYQLTLETTESLNATPQRTTHGA